VLAAWRAAAPAKKLFFSVRRHLAHWP
jgi:hypothetical protein